MVVDYISLTKVNMVIEEYNDERIQNIANIHDNLIIGKFLGILNSMDGV